MCQLKIDFPTDFDKHNRLDSLVIDSTPTCGSCVNRNWCPVFIIAIKSFTGLVSKRKLSKPEAIVKLLLKKEEASEAGKIQTVMVYTAALDLIKHNDKNIELVDYATGIKFLKETLDNEIVLDTVKELLTVPELSI